MSSEAEELSNHSSEEEEEAAVAKEEEAVAEEEEIENNNKGFRRRTWEESFQALVRYKKKYGDCLVPAYFAPDTALGHWVRKQRRHENNGTLLKSQRDMLDSLDFVWNLRDYRLAVGGQPPQPQPQSQPQQQSQQEKPSSVNSRTTISEDERDDDTPIDTERSKRRKKSKPIDLPITRILPAPRPPDPPPKATRTWKEMFQALVAFQKKHGHCNVPRRNPGDFALGQWVSKQRHLHDKLSPKQRAQLQEIGFDFELPRDKKQRQWKFWFERLRNYYVINGDCEVPQNYTTDPGLAAWVAAQHQAFSDETLSDEQIKKLDSVGFTFVQNENEINDESNQQEQEQQEQQQQQATQLPKGTARLLAETIRKDATVNSTRWSTNYQSLAEFYQENGHCIVARARDSTLSYWVVRQRQLNFQRKLRRDRRDLLDKLNFEWYLGMSELPEDYFDEMIERLQDFFRRHGHVDVPAKYLKGGLGEWVDTLKQQGREGVLDANEAERLLRVGFTWIEELDCWEKNFNEVSQEMDENWTKIHDTLSFSQEVENWLKVQYMLIDYDLLPPKRQSKLKSLGLAWDGSKLSWADDLDVEGLQDNRAWSTVNGSSGFDLKDAALAWTPDGPTRKRPRSEVKKGHSSLQTRIPLHHLATAVAKDSPPKHEVTDAGDEEMPSKIRKTNPTEEENIFRGRSNQSTQSTVQIVDGTNDFAGISQPESSKRPDP